MVGKSLESPFEGFTLHEAFKKKLEKPNNNFLGERLKDSTGKLEDKYTWYSNKECFERAETIGSRIINLDLVD